MTALRLPLVWVLMALTSAADAAEAEAQSSFTVSDAISWRRVVLPSGQLAIGPDPAVATFSPGGSRAAIQVRYGDVERDLIVDEIWIYESAVLQRYLEGSDGVQPPQGRLLLRQGAVARPLSALQWLGEKEIAFVMADPERDAASLWRGHRDWSATPADEQPDSHHIVRWQSGWDPVPGTACVRRSTSARGACCRSDPL